MVAVAYTSILVMLKEQLAFNKEYQLVQMVEQDFVGNLYILMSLINKFKSINYLNCICCLDILGFFNKVTKQEQEVFYIDCSKLDQHIAIQNNFAISIVVAVITFVIVTIAANRNSIKRYCL